MMKRFEVTIPIAGHFIVEVDAENIEEAKDKAYEMEESEGEVQWEILEEFSRGNVCYCPSPWNTVVEEIDNYDEDNKYE